MSLSDHPVFVTGATGFLGGALALSLAAQGIPTRALARSLHKSHLLRSSSAADTIEIVQGDITDRERMTAFMSGCGVVFHVAAQLHGPFAEQQRANVDGTRSIMRAAADAGITRVVHISTIAVYGTDSASPIREDCGCQPSRDAYAITKAQAESVVREFGAARDVPYAIIRPGCIFGPRSFWTRALARLATSRLVPLIGEGSGTLPAIDVDDVIALCLLAAEHPAAANQTFNATLDPAPTLRAGVTIFAGLAGRKTIPWLSVAPGPVRLAARLAALVAPAYSRLNDAPGWVDLAIKPRPISMDQARALLGWEPAISLEASAQRSLDWLRAERLI